LSRIFVGAAACGCGRQAAGFHAMSGPAAVGLALVIVAYYLQPQSTMSAEKKRPRNCIARS